MIIDNRQIRKHVFLEVNREINFVFFIGVLLFRPLYSLRKSGDAF